MKNNKAIDFPTACKERFGMLNLPVLKTKMKLLKDKICKQRLKRLIHIPKN